MTPSANFLRISRNPALIRVRPRETAAEIAKRLRDGVPAEPIVERRAQPPLGG